MRRSVNVSSWYKLAPSIAMSASAGCSAICVIPFGCAVEARLTLPAASRGARSRCRREDVGSADPAERVRDDGGARAADVLHEGELGARDLVVACRAGELQIRLDDLIDAGRADRVAACLEAAHRRQRQVAVDTDPALRAEPRAGARRREAGGLEAQDGHDRERIVQLEQAHVAMLRAGLLERFP